MSLISATAWRVAGVSLLAMACAAGAPAWALQPSPPAAAQVRPATSDPLANFAADVAVIFDIDSHPRLMLTESDHGVVSNRMLQLGEEYSDGWKIAAVTRANVILEKGADKRTIALTGRTQVASAPPPAATVAKVADTASSGPRPPSLADAIAAKDVRRIMQAGGSAKDVATALAASGATAGGKPIDPNTAAFVKSPTGVLGIAMRATSGATLILFGADFDGVIPVDQTGNLPYAQDVSAATAGLYATTASPYTTLSSAIAANDIEGIVLNGGSAGDVARAAIANGIQGGGGPPNPDTAVYIRSVYGDYGVRVTSTTGAYITIWGTQVSGYVPPNGPNSVGQDTSPIRYPMPGRVDTRPPAPILISGPPPLPPQR